MRFPIFYHARVVSATIQILFVLECERLRDARCVLCIVFDRYSHCFHRKIERNRGQSSNSNHIWKLMVFIIFLKSYSHTFVYMLLVVLIIRIMCSCAIITEKCVYHFVLIGCFELFVC